MEDTKVSDQIETVASGEVHETVQTTDTEDRVAHATYMKVLGEKKKKDELLADATRKIEEMEQVKLEESGQLKVLVEKLREDKRSLGEKYETERRKRAYDLISGQIKAKAAEVGCLDSEALMALGDFSTLEPNEDGTEANETDVMFAISEVQKKRPYLFRKSVPGVKDMSPSSRPYISTEKSANEMSTNDLVNKIKEVSAQINNG